MISSRTRHSLAQFLELQELSFVVVLLSKYGVRVSIGHYRQLMDTLNTVRTLDDRVVLEMLSEIAATSGDLRTRVNPKYRFDERMHDLTQCLMLDGYSIEGKKLIQSDPSIADAPPIDDDLILSMQSFGAPRKLEILQKINDSAQAFRSAPPDYNASLVNARVALETLASDIAIHVAAPRAATFDPSKWGEVLRFLRVSGEITEEEEVGLAGVFRFLSPGAHRPVGIPEVQMARLGRSLALNMCWFLLQNHLTAHK